MDHRPDDSLFFGSAPAFFPPADVAVRLAEPQLRRLHLIANKIRFIIPGAKGAFLRLGSFAMAAMLRRFGGDRLYRRGYPILSAESFVNPAVFGGTTYKAADWRCSSDTRGLARRNGCCAAFRGEPGRLHVRPLRRDARRRLRAPGPVPAAWQPKGRAGGTPGELRSLCEDRDGIKDFSAPPGAQAQRRKRACGLHSRKA